MENMEVMENEMVNTEIVAVDDVSTAKMSRGATVAVTGLMVCAAVGVWVIGKKVIGKGLSVIDNLKKKRASKKDADEPIAVDYTYYDEDKNETEE